MPALAFTLGSAFSLLLCLAYLIHVERMNRHLLEAVRQRERRKGYAQGYQDRALLSARHSANAGVPFPPPPETDADAA